MIDIQNVFADLSTFVMFESSDYSLGTETYRKCFILNKKDSNCSCKF